MDSSTVDWLNSSLKDIRHEKFKGVIEIENAEIGSMDDGQVVVVSDINRLNLTLITSEGEKKNLKAVLKIEPTSGPGKVIADDFQIFDKEITMYTDVLKSMEKVMSEVGDTDYPWPECYHSCDKKLLFQDLCEMGYKIVPMQDFLDVEHTLLVMKALGKFHALSMVLKQRGALQPERFKSNYFGKRMAFMINFHKSTIEGLSRVMKQCWEPEWLPIADKLSKVVESPGDAMFDMVESTQGSWELLNHGDFNIRNMLFHYQPGSTRPDGIKFVDFQMSHYSHLGYDLVTLLYSSLMPSLREDNMDTFLSVYVDALKETCDQHGYDGPLPSLEDVKSRVKSLKYLTAVLPLCVLPYAVASKNENFSEKIEEDIKKFSKPEEVTELSEDDKRYYSNPETVQLLKQEIKRCIQENII